MPVFNNILAGAAGQAGGAAAAGPIKSVRFNSSDSAYLNRTPSSVGNRRTWTYSCWVKRTALGGYPRMFGTYTGGSYIGWDIEFNNNDKIDVHYYDGSSYVFRRTTTAVYRDPSAWYHIVVAADTTASTADDRLKLYVNGVEVDTFDTKTNVTQNYDTNINTAIEHRIGLNYSYSDFYLADVYFIDGSALSPTSFGAFDDNNVWQAAVYSGTYGTNGFHLLDFENESTIGHDSSGNENDFTANNFSTSAGAGNDVLFDVPTNGDQSDTGAGGEVSGNYATFNPLHNNAASGGNGAILSDGNLETTFTTASSTGTVPATIFVNSGKWYCEFTAENISSSAEPQIGIVRPDDAIDGYIGQSGTNGVGYEPFRDRRYNAGTLTTPIFNQTTTSGTHTYGLALDLDDGTLDIYEDGTLLGELVSGLSGTWTFAAADIGGADVPTIIANFGQRPFAYTAPSGYKALCTANLPTPTIADGSDYFDTKLYDGNGSTNAITGLEFSPDLVWLKSRGQAKAHCLFDTVRGVNKRLLPNTTDEEYTVANTLTSFDSNGFTLGSNNEANNSGYSHVAWAWDAGTSTVSNTDGTLTSSVRASQTAGTSIVTYTGSGSATSVGHGLGAAPDAIIVKNRSTGGYKWPVYHSGLPANESLALNITWGMASIADFFDAPSSTVFNISSDADVNNSGDNFVAYCFSSVEGFSKFGTYAGNSNADGPFVYLGFKPALLIIKGYDYASNWFIHDYKRPGYNQNTGPLRMHAEVELTVTTYDLDILSNGFKMRTGGGDANQSSKNYAYFAWAQNPFQTNGGLAR